MSIRDSDVQRVREATDLVALIGRRVSLKRVGSRHVGLCPFHTEKTPSFSVDPAKGFYHCFGCKASGDAITFLRESEHLDFADAVEQLAAAANITLTYDAPGAQRTNQRRKWDTRRRGGMTCAAISARHRSRWLLRDWPTPRLGGHERHRGGRKSAPAQMEVRLRAPPPATNSAIQQATIPMMTPVTSPQTTTLLTAHRISSVTESCSRSVMPAAGW